MSDDLRLSGIVWITGAGKGIGRALALHLARLGHTVVVSARTESDLVSLAAEASGHGRVIPLVLDTTDLEANARAVEQIESEFGQIGLAILNAGTHSEVTADDFNVSEFRRVIDVNLMGAVHGLSALLPVMRDRGKGRIAVVASVAGYRGLPTASAYSASKAGVIAMCEALRPELEATGIELTLINPGFVDTPLTQRNTFPMPFMITADDAATRIIRGLGKKKFEIVFPLRMAFAMKLLRHLPYAMFFAITRRMVSR